MNLDELNKQIAETLPKPKNKGGRPKGSKTGVLTRKQKAFADALIADPKMTQQQAYRKAYNTDPNTKVATIDVSASKLIRQPQVVSYLSNYNDLVENTLINTINEWGNSEKERRRELAINASMYIHDKIHGKATQKIQQQSTVTKISIDLSGGTETTAPEGAGEALAPQDEVKYISRDNG